MTTFAALGDSITLGIGDPAPGRTWRGWAALLAEEDGGRHALTQGLLRRTAAHDDQAHTRQFGDRGQQVDPLLGGEPAHVPGEHLTARRELLP